MKTFVLLVVTILALAEVTTGSNEQEGRFILFKVRPKSVQEWEALVWPNAAYGEHPPIFLLRVAVGKSTLVLIEESKLSVLEGVLKNHRIRHVRKGLTLIESITVNNGGGRKNECRPGETKKADCNTCICAGSISAGYKWACTKMACPPTDNQY